jgi:hypothetical protein
MSGNNLEQNLLNINLLTMAGSGLLMLISGLSLYFFRDFVSDHLRFFLPIPPLGVAAYVFVFNLFKDYGGVLPKSPGLVWQEIITSTMIGAVIFGGFTTLLTFGIQGIKK